MIQPPNITKKVPSGRALIESWGLLFQGVGVQVGWQGQLGSSNGQAGVQVGTGVAVGGGIVFDGVGVVALVGLAAAVAVDGTAVLVGSGVNPSVGVLVGNGV